MMNGKKRDEAVKHFQRPRTIQTHVENVSALCSWRGKFLLNNPPNAAHIQDHGGVAGSLP